MATARDFITTALKELGVVDVTDAAPPAELVTLGLGLLNRLLDDWNADRHAVYADVFTAPVALTAGLNPHTIGPSAATFTATGHRPVTIEGIRLTTDNGETYLAPLRQQDAAWWHAQASPGTQSAYPTDFYYDPTWPNGSIYFAPEPSATATKASIWYRTVLAQVVVDDTITLPPGYVSALTETLKERLTALPMFASMASGIIAEAARMARGRAFGNNQPVKRLVNDIGCSGGTYRHETGPFSLMGR